jgi:hypothetical protein
MLWRWGLFLYMSAVFVAAFLYAPLANKLFEQTRIIYWHIPVAWVTVVAFLVCGFESIRYLRTRDLRHDAARERGVARVPVLHAATLTGAIFSRACGARTGTGTRARPASSSCCSSRRVPDAARRGRGAGVARRLAAVYGICGR